jgi:hypothetical protein
VVRLSGEDLLESASAVLEVLAGRTGFLRGWVGRATDEPTSWVLASEWESVGGYRRAMSSYDVRVAGAAVFAAALDEPAAFEVLAARLAAR